ncbi:MAG: hypothetical protein EHM42_04765, partial [Planctomycetaceae bacterium]
MARMHLDTVSLRAVDCVAAVLEVAREHADPRVREAALHLAAWDCRMEPDRVAASIFNVFFTHWCQRVADERFSGELALMAAGANGGLSAELLTGDLAGWFGDEVKRRNALGDSLQAALAFLEQKLGRDMMGWNWGRLHILQRKHILSGRGDLGVLLDRGGEPVRGDYVTVCNTGQAADYSAPTGAGYRMVADLADPQARLWAVDVGSQSGCPGSAHYDDQIGVWQRGEYHELSLLGDSVGGPGARTLELRPNR